MVANANRMQTRVTGTTVSAMSTTLGLDWVGWPEASSGLCDEKSSNSVTSAKLLS